MVSDEEIDGLELTLRNLDRAGGLGYVAHDYIKEAADMLHAMKAGRVELTVRLDASHKALGDAIAALSTARAEALEEARRRMIDLVKDINEYGPDLVDAVNDEFDEMRAP